MSYYSRRDDRDDVDVPTASGQLVKLAGEVHSALATLSDAVASKNQATVQKCQEFFARYEDANQ
jgi:hypothetical protein